MHRPGAGDRRHRRTRIAAEARFATAWKLGSIRTRGQSPHVLRVGVAGDRLRALTFWLLVRGRGDRPLEARVDVGAIRAHSSSKRPSVEPGDLAVLYAAVWQAIFGVAEIADVPEHDPSRERWAWRFPIRPLVVVPDLHDAPPVEAAGVFPQSLWRHSHIRLSEGQFEAARALIDVAAASA